MNLKKVGFTFKMKQILKAKSITSNSIKRKQERKFQFNRMGIGNTWFFSLYLITVKKCLLNSVLLALKDFSLRTKSTNNFCIRESKAL